MLLFIASIINSIWMDHYRKKNTGIIRSDLNNGTSQACAIASGYVALLRDKNVNSESLDNQQIICCWSALPLAPDVAHLAYKIAHVVGAPAGEYPGQDDPDTGSEKAH